MSQSEQHYIMNQNLIEEMVRLNRQGHIITEGMGGVFPELSSHDVSSAHDILDLACGPGEWAMHVAQEYPEKRVVGVDISARMIEYATVQARAAHLPAEFRVMDILAHPLDFPDNSFDIVNIRMIFGFMNKERWQQLLKECQRLLRPGGLVRVTETERGLYNHTVFEQYMDMWTHALFASGLSLSSDGTHYGTATVMKRLLREAGYHDVHHASYAIDFSAGEKAHDSIFDDCLLALDVGKPFLLKMGTSQKLLEDVGMQLREVRQQTDFCAYWLMFTNWGYSPRLR